ncbi:MAG TPA: VWA domain-containing protein [Vicinamibacterales bacterium]|jgi:VWFA-related protein|nr:VWA domain-containing protein [Vicinamibacterales bacterium]
MRLDSTWRKLSLAVGLLACGAVALPSAQAPAQQPPGAPLSSSQVIRRSVDLVTSDVIVRDDKGAFVPDLNKSDFEVYEDGVKQDIVSFVLTHGGRVLNADTGAPPVAPQEGILLPPTRPTSDASGRIFLIFVDDLHLDFRNTGRIRDLFKKIEKELVHDGDMFGIVSSGPSSIAIDMTYDRKRLDEAMSKIAGNGLKPSDIIDVPQGSQGPPEVRYRAHVAFSTVNDILTRLEQVHNRRKAFIWVSNGYDFDPFAQSRAKAEADRNSTGQQTDANGQPINDTDPFSSDTNNNEFAAADLAQELAEVTRHANRANATIYTIDPRGLVGGPDLDENVDPVEWQDYVRETQTSLRVLAEQTGGIAVVNQNDFDRALKKIDSETSDYYVLGYYSSNPDPLKRRRRIEIRVSRPGKYTLNYRQEYILKPPPKTSR